MILGLGQPDQGTVSVLGMSPAEAVSRGLVSAVLQTGGLLKDLTVRETVRLTASIYAEPRPVDEVLERAGISHLADRLVGKCSGGEQQRLRFAMALLPDPALMALDEPTAGMDVEGRRDFWSAIRRDAERGRTVLFATHYLEEADAYADRIILLRQGRIVADGTAAEVRNLSSGRSVRATLADADQASLSRLPGVRSVEIRGDRVLIQTMDSDAVARYLLTATAARDVEIVAHNLEDAFLALTSRRGRQARTTAWSTGAQHERGDAADRAGRRARRSPPLGGFNLTFLSIEIRRLLRNRRTVVVTIVVPVVLFLLFKANRRSGALEGIGFTAATTMIGVAVYGAMLAATSGGAMVSVERAQGWSRQLRLTPLRPAAYIAIKIIVAMLLGLTSVAVVYVIGAISGVEMTPLTWVATGLLAWAASLVFASFGLFMGYLLPSENVMQVIGPVLAVFALFGGLLVPLALLPSVMQDIAPFMPTYGVASIARFPLVGGGFDPIWLLSVILWTLAFAAAAVVLFRRDTRRA